MMYAQGKAGVGMDLEKTGLTGISKYGFYSDSLKDSKSPAQLALSVCYNEQKKALMIGNADWSRIVYVHKGSWLVYGYGGSFGAVGDGGLWTPNPPVAEWLPTEREKIRRCH